MAEIKPDQGGFKAMVGDQIVGSVKVRPDKADSQLGYISGLNVNSDHQRQGIGRELMDRAENSFQGAKLEVKADNQHAIRVYLSRGYQIVGAIVAKNGETYYRMEKT